MSYRNAPIHPFLRFVFLLLRTISWAGTLVFYRKRTVLGRQHLRFDGPAIIVVNHPSTLLDVLNTCIYIRQEPFFLANYSLFKHPISNWLLRRLFSIPVKRREDVAAGEDRNNDAAFEQSFDHVAKKGVLFIAAEGVSWMERWVRPFKTGAARIAFGAENRNNWQLGVKIIPVGLSYSAPDLFRSEVIVQFGSPVLLEDWASREKTNHEQAVLDFTTALENNVRALVLDTRDHTGQVFMEQLEGILQNKFPARSPAAYFAFRKKLITDNIDDSVLKSDTEAYCAALQSAQLTDQGLFGCATPSPADPFKNGLLLLAGLPFFSVGYAFWWLPCYLPWLVTQKLDLYIGYNSTVKLLIGLFTFPMALWAAFRLAADGLGQEYWGWMGMGMAVLLGYFTEKYLDAARRWRERNDAKILKKKDESLFLALLQQRQAIVERACSRFIH